jgi:hypothetical protein
LKYYELDKKNEVVLNKLNEQFREGILNNVGLQK